MPLGCDPITQLFAVVVSNITVPIDFAVVGKCAHAVPWLFHSKPKLSSAWIRKVVICDVSPSWYNL
jgi:hypothetical protein